MNNIYIIFICCIFVILFKIIKTILVKKKKYKLHNALNANYFIETLNNIIEENKYNLLEERMRLKNIDAYGNEDLKKWIGNPTLEENILKENINDSSKRFKEGIPYFW